MKYAGNMENIFKKVDAISSSEIVESIKIFGASKSIVPYFTIAIPTYKRSNTLKETLESALCQEEFMDYDIIVVDNNPERGDETEVFMQSYRDNSKVSYFKNSQNLGMAGNWNKCILLSTSERIILVHDDDILSPYALDTFCKISKYLPNDWALFKPNFKRFSNKTELSFETYTKITLRELEVCDFFAGDAVGAPTVILLNRDKMIDIGGVKIDYFPCIDYVMSLQATIFHRTFIAPTCYLGGYRVSVNESLSVQTMNHFFDMRTQISNVVMCHYHIPVFCKKIIHTFNFDEVFEWVKWYYNMPDYKYALPKDEVCHLTGMQSILARKIYIVIIRIFTIGHKKKISL